MTDASQLTATHHPLQNQWTLWYDTRLPNHLMKDAENYQKHYEANLTKVAEFETIEDFWRYYNHIPKASKIENNANYHLFKKDIKPMWEHEANKKGGKWNYVVKKVDEISDRQWEELVLAMIGETLEDGDEITGAVFSRRKNGDRIALWTRDYSRTDLKNKIGESFRKTLHLQEEAKVDYANHDESLKTAHDAKK
eukprot:TRINITY_DN1324_c0_g1_i1.p1 TRINITY_DN1324_c0_g1~~TRINITY_DN1324_c0_g1_i1.p1  ORF type:complete len:208 (+),score=96.10 TRINITY_DN1324_c0_g1_i1:41-625(+)